MNNYHIEKLASENALVGEGPMWDSDKKVLYWIDIQGKKFWEYNPKTNLKSPFIIVLKGGISTGSIL